LKKHGALDVWNGYFKIILALKLPIKLQYAQATSLEEVKEYEDSLHWKLKAVVAKILCHFSSGCGHLDF
jgi:hypothetical protein